MHQVTLRLPDPLSERLRQVAAEQGTSVNAFATAVLRAAVDPEAAGSEIERTRERLARGGLLMSWRPLDDAPPDPDAVVDARRRAAGGTPLGALVSEDRG